MTADLNRRQALTGGSAGVVVTAAASAAMLYAEAAKAAEGALDKKAENLGMRWEEAYGYAQAVKVGDTIYLSGQLSHDSKGKMVPPAPLDADGHVTDHSNMGPQMAQAYANAKIHLERYGAGMDNVVEEVLYVTDMDAAGVVQTVGWMVAMPVQGGIQHQ